jgi:hypothetical protein
MEAFKISDGGQLNSGTAEPFFNAEGVSFLEWSGGMLPREILKSEISQSSPGNAIKFTSCC